MFGNYGGQSQFKINGLESVKYDGTDRTKLYHVGLVNPIRLDLFESHIYWVSLQSGNSLAKLDKFGRGAFIKIIAELDMVQDLKVFHSQKVPNSGRKLSHSKMNYN